MYIDFDYLILDDNNLYIQTCGEVLHISYNGNNNLYYPAEGEEEEGLCNLFANHHVSHLWFAYYLHRVYFLLHWGYIG